MFLALILAPGPAIHQTVTLVVGQSAALPVVSKGKIFVAGRKLCRAYDAKTLRPLWSKTLPFGARSLAVSGTEILYCGQPEYRKTDGKLFALDSQTGAVRWSIGRKESGDLTEAAPMSSDKSRIYVPLTPNGISAIDQIRHQILWTHPFKKGPNSGLEASFSDGRTLVVYEGSNLHALDAASGKSLWNRPSVYFMGNRFAVTNGVVWANFEGWSEGIDVRTGKTRWKSSQGCGEVAMALNGKFFGSGKGSFAALDPQSGHTLWSHVVGAKDVSGGSQFLGQLGNDVVVQGSSRTIAVGPDGKERWSVPSNQSIDWPIWSDHNSFVCFDGRRLFGYATGAPEALPTNKAERSALATRMANKFDELDAAGIERLKALGEDAFGPVLQAFLKTCDQHDMKSEDADSYDLYSRYHDLAKVLEALVQEQNTSELIRVISTTKPKSSARPFILGALAKVGDPDIVVPYFLEELKAKVPSFEMYESATYVARDYIIRSQDPRAVAFMLEKLKDPKADPILREAAYYHLGATGEAGVRAVLAERRTRELLPPVEVRLELSDIGSKSRDGKTTTLLAEKSDPQGHMWGLAASGIFGSRGDLWILEKVGGRWTHPAFVGVSLDGISRWVKTKEPEPKAFGKTAKELREGAWFTTLVGRKELFLDSDGDGLTDLEEARLGTNPKNPDTDGDGDRDGVDPWPNAAKRPLTDAEQALAAVFEARHHFRTYSAAAVQFGPKDMKPFEMPGWNGPVVWQTEIQYSTPLQKCYEQGVGFLSFDLRDDAKPWTDQLKWNKDHTQVEITISTYYGGLSGDGFQAVVRKFGNDWVVVSLDQAYVS